MRFGEQFVRQPVLAVVLSLAIVALGIYGGRLLPIEQFPHTVSGTVTVTTAYYGADPATVAGFITTPLEGRISRASGIDYVTSTSEPGLSTIVAVLRLGYDPARALAEIQANVTAATAEFPPGVQASSISLSAGSGIMNLGVSSATLSSGQISDYVQRVVTPRLQAVHGVQAVEVQGAPRLVMRVWLDPERIAAVGMSPEDVQAALAANNFVSGAGQTQGGATRVDLGLTSVLQTPEQFGALVIREREGRIIQLRDVARVELGRSPESLSVIADGRPGVFIRIRANAEANVLDVTRALSAQVDALRSRMPPGLQIEILNDNGHFIRLSIEEVVRTLFEALVIVSLVVFLFLGSTRSMIVPLVTIPISLIGTLGLMTVMGFSINLLTLLAMVLSIGLVVDDAIIVVENVNSRIATGVSPVDAAVAAVSELVQPIIAMTIVLIAAYLPLGLQKGLTGALFTQFAFTLAAAVTMSAIVALTLSPMMSAYLLRHRPADEQPNSMLGRLEAAVETIFAYAKIRYVSWLDACLSARPIMLALTAIVLISVFFFYTGSKHELSPREDRGVLLVSGTASPNSTTDALQQYDAQILDVYRNAPSMRHFWHVVDAPYVDGGVILADWKDRLQTSNQVEAKIRNQLSDVPGLDLAVYQPPYLPGAQGMPVGFVLQSAGDFDKLSALSERFLARVKSSGLFAYAESDLNIDQPQSTIVVDRAKMAALGITMDNVATSLNAIVGGGFVGFFLNDERSYRVEPLADRRFRLNPDQVLDYPIATVKGTSIPLRSIAHLSESVVPRSISHFQQLNAATINAIPASGVSQSEAAAYLSNLASLMLPSGYSTDAVGPLRQYLAETGGVGQTIGLALLITYLALAALFRSFIDPLIILITAPLALSGALLFIYFGIGGLSINLFTEVGLVTLMGLISKHGILIVEVANARLGEGYTRRAAVEFACAERLRPILMTTAAMVIGVIPLVSATGAGAASRFAMGTVIVAGLSLGTLFTLFVLPVVYSIAGRQHAARQAPDIVDRGDFESSPHSR
ncbi:efflux RND transporter permease subunit [Sphingomonas sp. 1185]|uniref:efflux RND transporter permease subunit n=1 Tax=Sphingomonas sp. 1185 TaxID=3156411 RepID=UPI003392D5D8